MATSTSECPQWKYDVFLSFRGLDTRHNFTGHLYDGLTKGGIHTFMDDSELEHGSSISEELLKAIRESQVAIIIFSLNYATSGWCLDELVHIIDCKIRYKQLVIPVFYNVDPATVRYQIKSFADAFEKHESRYKDDDEGMQKVQRWRTALTAAAHLSGHDIRGKSEVDCINITVDEISSKLIQSPLPYLQDLVGIETHLKEVKSLLKIDEIIDPLILGIWGLAGVGKTTLARAIFETLSYRFEATCFLENIKENKDQIHSVQNIMLEELLGKKALRVNNKEDGKRVISRRLCKIKVLVVLDDIAHKDHLAYLAGKLGWFGDGSRIIATTRDRHLMGKNVVYQVTTLGDDEAMQLFIQHAFEDEVPDKDFKELSWEVVNHAKGLPLALKVWGSFFHNRCLPEWRSAVDRIKKISNSKEIVESLKISYDGLELQEQEIFLDIACFFRGYEKEKVIEILESCDFQVVIGLDVLIKKSLVFVSKSLHKQVIEMHDLIQEMGKYVVNMQRNPEERSRIWDIEDLEAISNSTGSKAVEAIVLRNPPDQRLCENVLKTMNRLRMLHIAADSYDDSMLDNDDVSIEYLSNNLCWFVFEHYTWKSMPANFEPKRLIHLNLEGSSLYHLWTEPKDLRRLRRLNLNRSIRLKQTPDFTGMPNLEYVSLSHCASLEEVHSSLGNCNKLIQLDLSSCENLKRFPCVNVDSLEEMNLWYCKSLEKFPEIVGRMKVELDMFKYIRNSGIREVPSSIQYQTHLTKLDFSSFKKLESLPNEIGNLVNLELLDARYTLISQPPASIARLNKLKILRFSKYYGEYKEHFVFPPVADGLRSLEKLDLKWCNLTKGALLKDIGYLSSLKKLNLSGNNFEHLPQSIGQLGDLRCLKLSWCERLKELPDFTGMPNLEALDLSECTNLEELHHSFEYLENLTKLDLSGCSWLKKSPDFTGIPNLETLDMSGCRNLEEVHQSVGYLKGLTELHVSGCKSLSRFPSLCIDSLNVVNLTECYSLEKFPEIRGSKELELVIHMLDGVMKDQHLCLLIQNISSDSLSQRVFTVCYSNKIPRWFDHQGMDKSVSIKLPENWCECDNLLGVAVCYSDRLIETTAELISLCDDRRTHQLALCNHSEFDTPADYPRLHFFLVPIAGTSGANDYGVLRLSFSKIMEFGFRLLYKDEVAGCEPLQMREDCDEQAEDCHEIRRSTYENSEQHESDEQAEDCHEIRRSTHENSEQHESVSMADEFWEFRL